VIECQREQDVIEAVAAGRWPGRVGAELAAHVAACAVCRDVALVAAVISAEQDAAWQDARVPSSAHVWWRAQMRARREAARAAARPITLIQGVAAGSAAGLAVAAFGYASNAALIAGMTGWWSRWSEPAGLAPETAGALQSVRDAAAGLATAAASLPHAELVAATGLVLLLMPAALYFVLSEK
jgi:hypothetical protein